MNPRRLRGIECERETRRDRAIAPTELSPGIPAPRDSVVTAVERVGCMSFIYDTNSMSGRSARNIVIFLDDKSLRNHRSDGSACRTNLINTFCGRTCVSKLTISRHLAFCMEIRIKFLLQLSKREYCEVYL